MSGIFKSVITRSKGSFLNCSSASLPLLASFTTCPSIISNMPMASRTAASSSARSMCLHMAFGASAGKPPSTIKIGLRPFHVFPGAGVDLDLLAGLDEQGRLHGDAGFHRDGLL